jgi:hypothetical protein
MANHTVPINELQEINDGAPDFESVKSILPRALSHLFSREELQLLCSTLVSA